MNLEEKIPIERLRLLNRIDYDMFKKYTPKCESEKDRKVYFRDFKDFLKDLIKSKGVIKRLYKYTDATPVGEGGRLFCGNSIQGIAKDFRGFLCKGICTDIDMKNAHPKILLWLCDKYNISCPELREYCVKRNEILTNLTSQLGKSNDFWKTTILKMVNTSWESRRHKSEFLKKFDKEMKEIQSKLIQEDDLIHIWNCRPTKTYNFLGSNINRILCHFENEILQIIVNELNKKGFEIMSLMFDGLMIYGNHYQNETLLRDLEELIKSYNVQLDYKLHSEEVNENELHSLPEEEDEKKTEIETAKLLINDYPHWKYCEKELWVFDEITGLWSNDDIIKKRIAYEYGKGKQLENDSGRTGVLNSLKMLCIDAEWRKISSQSSKYMLLFNNGIYDGKLGTMNPFDPKVVFYAKIHQNYLEKPDIEYMDSIFQRLFKDPLGEEIGTYFIIQLARALFADNPKRILFGLGESGAGKSLIAKALLHAGGDYIGNFNAESLAVSKSTADEAQQMRWAMLIQHKRIIFSNELKMTVELNANAIKKIASGGDALIGRSHGGEETSFVPMFMAILFANDIPKISGYDEATDNRLKVIPYAKKYVSQPKELDELKADPEIEKEILTDKFKQHFLRLLMDTYKHYCNGWLVDEPKGVSNSKKSWGIEEVNIINVLLQDYEITNKITDYIPSVDFKELCEENNITSTKFGREINKYCEKNQFENVKSKAKKEHGKTVQVWYGIRIREPIHI
jgi:hypothetical protein